MGYKPLLDTCPKCGSRSLTAVCEVLADYAVENDGNGGQDWITEKIADDQKPLYFRCTSCETEFHRFEMEGGSLVGLTPDEPPKPCSEEEFVNWLTEKVAGFAESDEDIDDESLDCGDLWRGMEDRGDLDEIGVACAWDYEGQTMYFSGVDAEGKRWAVGSGYEVGIEEETIWLNPLCNMTFGPDLVEQVKRAAERMHRRADELGRLVS